MSLPDGWWHVLMHRRISHEASSETPRDDAGDDNSVIWALLLAFAGLVVLKILWAWIID